MNNEKTISFIIVNFNGKEHLKECFSTLNKLNYPKDKLEFIMVDNGSKDGSVQFVRSKFKNVKIIQNSENEGFAKPNNDAAKIAKGDYIALINNDMKLDSEWLNNMIKTLESYDDEKYVCAGSRILNWDGSKLDFAGGSINFYGYGYQYDFGMGINDIDKKNNIDKDILFACGGAMLIDKKVYLEIGGLDEDYFAYFEDVDLGWRLWVLGYKVTYCSAAICYHKHNSTSKKMNRNKVMRMFERNSLFSVYKNYEEDKVYKILTSALLLKNYKQYSEKSFEKEERPEVYGTVDFIEKLSKMNEKREYIQKNRKRTDNEIVKLFMLEPYKNLIIADKECGYNKAIDKIISSVKIDKYFGKQKYNLFIICTDNVASRMAGPGIRYYEIAKQLSNICNVTLAIPNKTDIQDVELGFKFYKYDVSEPQGLINKFLENDMVLLHGMILEKVTVLKNLCKEKIVIVDLYDPYTIENLEIHKHKPLLDRENIHKSDLGALITQLNVGDYFICANDKQKDLWIGMLSAFNKVNPREFDLSSTLDKLIGIVPFGISNVEPKHTRNALKEKICNFKEDDKIFIWGGGVWNWFDPLTVIRAIAEISKGRDDIKLFFLGVKHPNPEIPEMEMTREAIELAESLGVKDKYVFFNMDWVEYEDRQNFLLEAYGGVSCHFDNIETRFSFRTRILDYLWAKLPIISTKGDYFAKDIREKQLGLVVDFQDVNELKNAILKVVDDKQFYEQCVKNLEKYRQQYKWDVTTTPLKEFCCNPIKKQNDDINKFEKYIVDMKQVSKTELTNPLYGSINVGQKFRCRYPNLSVIEFMVGTYARENNHKINFKLYECLSNKLIYEDVLDASIFVDNSWVEVQFPPIVNSEGRTFYFSLEADENANALNCITLFKNLNVNGSGNIVINGIDVEGSLTYRTYCILLEDPIKEDDGIVLRSLAGEYEHENIKNEEGNNIEYLNNKQNDYVQIKGNVHEMQKSISKLSNNISDLNEWKNRVEHKLDIFRSIKRRFGK